MDDFRREEDSISVIGLLKQMFKIFVCFALLVGCVVLIYSCVIGLIEGHIANSLSRTINKCDKAFVNVGENRAEVDVNDIEALKDTFNSLEFLYDGDTAYLKCGFGEDFSVEFLNSKSGEKIFVCLAKDGDGGMEIEGDYYYISDKSQDNFYSIVGKYGMYV